MPKGGLFGIGLFFLAVLGVIWVNGRFLHVGK